MIVKTKLAMIGELRKVLKRLHYSLEVMLVYVRWSAAYPNGQAMSVAEQFYSLAF